MNIRRRVAEYFGRLAVRLLPRHRAHWGAAILSEIEAIEDDGEAAGWAMGTAAGVFFMGLRSTVTAASTYRSGLAALLGVVATVDVGALIWFLWAGAGTLATVPAWSLAAWCSWSLLVFAAAMKLYSGKRTSAWLLSGAGLVIGANQLGRAVVRGDGRLLTGPEGSTSLALVAVMGVAAVAAFLLTPPVPTRARRGSEP